MSFLSKIFGVDFSVRVENLREALQEQESLKKSTLAESLEYKRIEASWKPYQEGLEKGQNIAVISRLNDKYLQARQKFEANLKELTNKQGSCQKGIINQITKEPALLPLLFASDFLSKSQYEAQVCSLVKAHKEKKASDAKLKEIIKYQKSFMVDGEPVYVKDNRTQYADTIIIDDENRILFTIRNKNDAFCPGAYCLPGGHIEDGETPKQAAQRELLEETGIELRPEDFVPCGEYIDNKSHIYYFCVRANAEPVVLQEEEQIQYEKVPFDEVDKKPLLMNLQSNLEHLIAIPKTMLNAEADNARILYFDGKTFRKGCAKLPFVKSLTDSCAIFDAQGRCWIYEQEKQEGLEKAAKSAKLVAKKIFVHRKGKTFLTTVWVNPETKEVVGEKDPDKAVEVENISGEYIIGDIVRVKTARGEREGKIECLVKTKEGAYIGMRTKEGKYTEAYLKSIKGITKLDGNYSIGLSEVADGKTTDEEPDPIEYSVDVVAKKLEKEGLDFSTLSTLGGSSQTFLAKLEGEKFFLKRERDKTTGAGQLKSEILADAVYRAMGFGAPDSRLVKIKDTKTGETKTYKLSKYIEARELGSLGPISKGVAIGEIKKGFVLDCLLANWDVIGANSDNILVTEDNRVIRIDNGSAFEYRAKGSLKPEDSFLTSSEVGELFSMRDSTYAAASVKAVFGSLKDDEIVEQIKQLQDKFPILLNTLNKEGASEAVKSAIEKRMEYLVKWAKQTEEIKTKVSEWDVEPKDKQYLSRVSEKYFEDWDSFDFVGNPGIKDALKKGILEKEEKRNAGYEAQAKAMGMTIGEYKAKMQNLAERLCQASYPGIRLHSAGAHEAFSKVFAKGGRFESLFETSTGCGCTRKDSRARYEKKVFNFVDDTETDKSLRPIYGCASCSPRGEYGHLAAENYGDIFVEINKEKAIKSATITTGDSLHAEDRYFPVPFGKPHFTMFYGLDGSSAKSIINSIEGYIGGETALIEGQGSYLELQYHNQLTQDDVKTIHCQVGKGEALDTSISKVTNRLIKLSQETGKAHEIDIYL